MLEFPDWIFDDFLKPERIYFDENSPGTRINLIDKVFSINNKLDCEGKIVCLIGVAVCLHPKFISYTYGLKELSLKPDIEKFSEITCETMDLYKNNPKFVKKINGILEKASKRYHILESDLNIPPEVYN